MSETYDVIVVGVGAMGSATCYALAKRGVKVLGLEQFDIAHIHGSSGGQTRLIRLAYYEHAHYVPLLQRAYLLWDKLGHESGQQILHRTGGLYIGPKDGTFVAGSLASAQEHSLHHDVLDHSALRNHFPHFQLPEDFAAVFEPDAGYLLSETAIAMHARLAVRAGAIIKQAAEVLDWQADKHGVSVTMRDEVYRAGQLIFTAGAWTSKLLTDLPVPLAVTRQVLAWVTPDDPRVIQESRHPCWAIEHQHGLLYGVPLRRGEATMKVAYHHRGAVTDPDTIDRRTYEQDARDLQSLMKQYLPMGSGAPSRMHVCMYTYSPDEHFILDRHPKHPRVLLACGFSGHGFKFAPVMGQVLSDLVTADKTDLPVDFLKLSRFLQKT